MKHVKQKIIRKYAGLILIGGTLLFSILGYGFSYLILWLCNMPVEMIQSVAQVMAGISGVVAYLIIIIYQFNLT
ncbi:MAG: hypothetical protein HFG29_00240 [Eubacterium sp.]|nr:hypothetical protein [Eubacterium sp.]